MKLSELDEKELVQVSAGKKAEGECPAGRTKPDHGCCREKCPFMQYWVTLKVNKYDFDQIYFTCSMGVSGQFIDFLITK